MLLQRLQNSWIRDLGTPVLEEGFQSSWMSRLEYFALSDSSCGYVIIALKDRPTAFLHGPLPGSLFQEWREAKSKGRFYHAFIKGKFQIGLVK